MQAGVGVGKTVYVAGAGPVGICCAASSILLGAASVVVGDVNPARLHNIQKLGPWVKALDIGALKSDEPEAINAALKQLTGKEVVDCACDCVGYEGCGIGPAKNENRQEAVLDSIFAATKTGGAVGVPGIYLKADPKGEPHSAQ